MTAQDELWNLVRELPRGKCTTYGELGRALHHPTTGRMVGRWMANCPDTIPWWRVVNKQGALPIWKRDPSMAALQRQLLKREKVPFVGDLVNLEKCGWAEFK